MRRLRSRRFARRAATTTLFSTLVWACLAGIASTAGAASWTATGSMGTARDSHTSTLLPNGKVLVAGGTSTGAPLPSAELYDPATGTFSATGSMGTARFNHIAALLPNGMVLVAGGTDSSNSPLASAELYDPAAGTFSATGPMGTVRHNPSATRLLNGKILISGGRDGRFSGFSIFSAELYDPATGTFSATGSMGTARDWHMLTLLSNGKILVSGGSSTDGFGTLLPLSSAELYDPATGTFSATGSMGTARYNPTATFLTSGKVLVAGGYNLAGGILQSAEVYDPATGIFTPSGGKFFAVFNTTATRLPDGTVLFAGGEGPVSVANTASELYDPGTGNFYSTAFMGTGRYSHYATDSKSVLLSNGQVLVAGGFAGGVSLASAELYDPGTGIPSITSISPVDGPIGTLVTISGSGFGALQGSSTVAFNGTIAGSINSWSNTQIQVTVPVGATTGPVVVTVAGTPSNGMPYTVPPVAPPPPSGGGGGGGCAVAGTSSGWSDGVGACGAYLLLAVGFAIRRCRMRRLARVIAAVAVTVLALAGCATVETKKTEGKTTQGQEEQTAKTQATDASSSMKQVMLNPKGFNMDWNCRGMLGRSSVVFRDVGSKIVVDIDSYGMGGCTTDVKITDNGILFDGCRERDFVLTYDPGNPIPFKGRNRVGCLLEMRAR